MVFGRNYRHSTDTFFVRLYKTFLGFPTSVGDRVRAHNVMELVHSSKNENILDAGCGIGVYCLEMASRGCTVVGADLSKEKLSLGHDAIENMGMTCRVGFVRCDLCTLPFISQHFDKVLCVDVLEHIEDDSEACSELSRILKLRGILVLHVPNNIPHKYFSACADSREIGIMYACIGKSLDHVRDGYSSSSIEALLKMSRFHVVLEKQTFKACGSLAWWIGYKARRFSKIQGILFPLLYVIARLDSWLNQDGNGFLVVANKV